MNLHDVQILGATMNLRKAAIPTAGKDSPSFITAGAVLAW
jgi:hypothetical protein